MPARLPDQKERLDELGFMLGRGQLSKNDNERVFKQRKFRVRGMTLGLDLLWS